MSNFGTKQFLYEQMTTASVSSFRDPDEPSIQMGPYAQMMSQPSTVTSLSAQPITDKGSQITSQAPSSQTQQRGLEGDDGIPDGLPPFDIDVFDPDNQDTYPQTWDDFNEWFQTFVFDPQSEFIQTLFLLSGTNSISGLSGMLGVPANSPYEFFYMLALLNSFPPEFGGFCWGCFFDTEGGWDGSGLEPPEGFGF